MRSKLAYALACLAGGFLVYCSQNAMDAFDGGPRGDAKAANGTDCCKPLAKAFVEIAKGELAASKLSPAIAVGDYAQVVLVVDNRSNPTCWAGITNIAFGVSAQGPFYRMSDLKLGSTYTNADKATRTASVRLTVNGPFLRFLAAQPSNCKYNYTVLGVGTK